MNVPGGHHAKRIACFPGRLNILVAPASGSRTGAGCPAGSAKTGRKPVIDLLVSDADWDEFGRLVNFEAEELDVDVLQDLMKILVSKGAY